MTIIIISGVTASGKSRIALNIADKLNQKAMIINADSVQLYKDIDILAATPTAHDTSRCMHAMYNIITADQVANVSMWLTWIEEKIEYCLIHNIIPIVVGGTCMYIDALINGLSHLPHIPEHIIKQINQEISLLGISGLYNKYNNINPQITHNIKPGDTYRLTRTIGLYLTTGLTMDTIHMQNPKKLILPNIPRYCINILPANRNYIYEKCNQRFEKAFYGGAQEEVQNIINKYSQNIKIRALGFYEIMDYLQGQCTEQQTLNLASQNIRRYAKRQYTWFRNRKSHNYLITDTNIQDNTQICWDLIQNIIY